MSEPTSSKDYMEDNEDILEVEEDEDEIAIEVDDAIEVDESLEEGENHE